MLRIILLQLVTMVVAAGVAGLLGGATALWSALLGGICCVVPNGLFACDCSQVPASLVEPTR